MPGVFNLNVWQSQGLVCFVSHFGQHILYSQGVGLVFLRLVNLSMLYLLTYYINALVDN